MPIRTCSDVSLKLFLKSFKKSLTYILWLYLVNKLRLDNITTRNIASSMYRTRALHQYLQNTQMILGRRKTSLVFILSRQSAIFLWNVGKYFILDFFAFCSSKIITRHCFASSPMGRSCSRVNRLANKSLLWSSKPPSRCPIKSSLLFSVCLRPWNWPKDPKAIWLLFFYSIFDKASGGWQKIAV